MKELTASKSSALTISQIVRVRFPDGSSVIGGEHDFYFGSLAAVFDMFSEQEIGVALRTLYAIGLVADGVPYLSSTGVEIRKVSFYRKRQKSEIKRLNLHYG